MYYLGNKNVLLQRKIGFLCSQKYTASIVLKSYDWAIAQRNLGNCVISGFHSTIEKDVLNFLLKGKQPVIVVLSRGLYKSVPVELEQALHDERLLIISPFGNDTTRITKQTCYRRNQLIAELSDDLLLLMPDRTGRWSSY